MAVVDGRIVYVLLDQNVAVNEKVQSAENALIAELRSRRCKVMTCRIPRMPSCNGPDDLIGVAGDEALAQVLSTAEDSSEQAHHDTSPVAEDGVPPHAEDSLALEFARRHGEGLRYTSQWGKWLQWNGCRWVADDKLGVFTEIRKLCRAAAARESATPSLAKTIASARTVAAVEKLARCVEPHPAVAKQWDEDPWCLNTQGGVINLQLGTPNAFVLRPARNTDYCTKMTAAAPGGDCQNFKRFLVETTGGDTDLQRFIQMIFGYCLTGSTREQVLFDFFGPPGTGKTTLIELLAWVMGSYAISCPVEVFLETKTINTPPSSPGLRAPEC